MPLQCSRRKPVRLSRNTDNARAARLPYWSLMFQIYAMRCPPDVLTTAGTQAAVPHFDSAFPVSLYSKLLCNLAG